MQVIYLVCSMSCKFCKSRSWPSTSWLFKVHTYASHLPVHASKVLWHKGQLLDHTCQVPCRSSKVPGHNSQVPCNARHDIAMLVKKKESSTLSNNFYGSCKTYNVNITSKLLNLNNVTQRLFFLTFHSHWKKIHVWYQYLVTSKTGVI